MNETTDTTNSWKKLAQGEQRYLDNVKAAEGIKAEKLSTLRLLEASARQRGLDARDIRKARKEIEAGTDRVRITADGTVELLEPPPEYVSPMTEFWRSDLGETINGGIDVIPFVGDGKNILEGAIGKTLLTKRKLTFWGRAGYIGAGFIPVIPAKAIAVVLDAIGLGTTQLQTPGQRTAGVATILNAVLTAKNIAPRVKAGVNHIRAGGGLRPPRRA